MEFFGRIVMQPTDSFGLTRHACFRGWLAAMLLLLRMASGEAWNTVMHDTAIRPAATRAAGAHVLYGGWEGKAGRQQSARASHAKAKAKGGGARGARGTPNC